MSGWGWRSGGLVVTVAALKGAEANITWPITELQATLRYFSNGGKAVADVRGFLRDVLEWSDDSTASGDDILASLRCGSTAGRRWRRRWPLRSEEDESRFVFLVEETHRKDLDAASDDKPVVRDSPSSASSGSSARPAVSRGCSRMGWDFQARLRSPRGRAPGG